MTSTLTQYQKTLSKIPKLTLKEQNKLALNPTKENLNRLYESLLKMIYTICERECGPYINKHNYSEEFMECLQQANLIMLGALDKWQPERGSFSSFVFLYVTSRMRNYRKGFNRHKKHYLLQENDLQDKD